MPDVERQDIVKELYSRRESLTTEQQPIVLELAKRFGIDKPAKPKETVRQKPGIVSSMLTGFGVGDVASGMKDALNPVSIAKGLGETFQHPTEVLKGLDPDTIIDKFKNWDYMNPDDQKALAKTVGGLEGNAILGKLMTSKGVPTAAKAAVRKAREYAPVVTEAVKGGAKAGVSPTAIRATQLSTGAGYMLGGKEGAEAGALAAQVPTITYGAIKGGSKAFKAVRQTAKERAERAAKAATYDKNKPTFSKPLQSADVPESVKQAKERQKAREEFQTAPKQKTAPREEIKPSEAPAEAKASAEGEPPTPKAPAPYIKNYQAKAKSGADYLKEKGMGWKQYQDLTDAQKRTFWDEAHHGKTGVKNRSGYASGADENTEMYLKYLLERK